MKKIQNVGTKSAFMPKRNEGHIQNWKPKYPRPKISSTK